MNRSDEGLKILGDALERHADSPEAWDAWFTALFNASQVERLAAEFTRLPRVLVGDARFAKHDAMIAQNLRDWPRTAAAYRRAFEFEPFNEGVCYRYRFVLRQVRDDAEYARVDRFYKDFKSAAVQMRRSYSGTDQTDDVPVPDARGASDRSGVYYEVLEIKTLGLQPHPDSTSIWRLFEKKWAGSTKRTWHRLVLRDSPGDALSLAALARLR